MSKYIDADKLKATLETRIAAGLDGYGGNLKWLLENIDSLQQEQPSLPDNLDEAANRQAALEQPYKWEVEQDGSFGVTPLFVMSNIRSAFKAGAEWMAGHNKKW